MTLLHLFFIFFYIGLFAIGGGLVAATFMQQTLVEQYGLISAEKFYSILAISESTPGPIGVNLATYLGTELFGPAGGIVCTLGEVLPSFIIIVIIAKFFSKVQEKPLVKSVFSVLRPVTTGMILTALVQVLSISMLKIQSDKNPIIEATKSLFYSRQSISEVLNFYAIGFYGLFLILLAKTKLHPAFFVVLGAAAGILFL